MINTHFLHTIIDSELDDVVLDKINHEQLYTILEKADIDLDKLSSKRKKNDYIPFHRFNFIIKDLHDSKKINITDSCIFLLTDMISLKDLIGCLNEENKYILRLSLAERNCIPIKKSSLDFYMYKKKKKSIN